MTRRFESEFSWLAFLLTGRPAPGIYARSRTVMIAKALAAIQADLAASLRRTQSLRAESHGAGYLPPRDWSLPSDRDRLDLERALLAIDIFPRCVLLLTVFEKLPLPEAATLLGAGQDLVLKAKVIGLYELTRNLALNAGWQSTQAAPAVFTTERQHA